VREIADQVKGLPTARRYQEAAERAQKAGVPLSTRLLILAGVPAREVERYTQKARKGRR